MKKSKSLRIVSLLLALIMVVGVFPMTASAASSSSMSIVKFNTVYGGTINEIHQKAYTIKGNLLNKKPVKIQLESNLYASDKLIKQLASFDVKVHKPDGSLAFEYRNLKIGDTFRLPVGKKNYTIYICSKFKGYDRFNTYHQIAAMLGRFKLSY